MDKSIFKFLSADSNKAKHNDLWIIKGSPEHRFSVLRQTKQTLAAFSQGQLDFDQPMKRDIVKKFYRNAQKERVEITAKSNNGK